ncbi:MAG: hypothetical protein CMH83_01465 [Nocardioides sp.]|nr:hypothetical protein [Nocardioides sp.]
MTGVSTLPTVEQARSLPLWKETVVGEDAIDENGHMNITVYFRDAAFAPWDRLGELGLAQTYIDDRRKSMFTVEHRVKYLGELRLGEPYAVHFGIAARTDKALHGMSFIVDTARDRISCTMEMVWLHVSMESRRTEPFPDDVRDTLDAQIALNPWLAEVATGLSIAG